MNAGEPQDAMVDALLQQAAAGVPVLRVTAAEIARMRAEQERVSSSTLASAILRDPLMTLRVLRFLYSHRTRSQTADITTIAHAIMMLGQARFFREFEQLETVEDRVGATEQALAKRIMSRSRLAALLARELAVQRHDLDPEEVMVAALLHDIPKLLLVIAGQAVDLEARTPPELRPRLFAQLEIPGLVRELNEDPPPHNPRVVNVHLACELARHCDTGWPAAAIAADLAEAQRFLRTSEPQAWERVRKTVLAAAREWHYYETLPAAAGMPFIHDEFHDEIPSPSDGSGSAI